MSLGFPTHPISAQSEPATPRCAPEEQDNEDWEQEMLKVVRKDKETQKGTTVKNKELQALNQQLHQENQDLHLDQQQNKQLIEAMERQLAEM